MSSLAERIEQRMAQLQLRQVDLARMCHIKPSSVQQWRNGRTKAISGETLLLASVALHCSPKWLATGMGPMEMGVVDAQTIMSMQQHTAGMVQEQSAPYLLEREQEVLKLFRALPALGQAEALDYLKYLLTKHPSAFSTTGTQQRDQVPGAAKRAA